jgi:hypothetical protein
MLKINGSTTMVKFQYEKLPKFCFRCEMIKHGSMGCSERREARKQHALVEYGMWLRASSPKRIFGARARQETDRRDTSSYQWEKTTGFGHYDHGRRTSPGRKRSPFYGDDGGGGGERPGQQEEKNDPKMESSRNFSNFPSGESFQAETEGVNDARSNSKSKNHGEETREEMGEINGDGSDIFKSHVVGDTTAVMKNQGMKESGTKNGKNERGAYLGSAKKTDGPNKLAYLDHHQAEHVGVGITADVSEEGWCRGQNGQGGLEIIFFTLYEVEQKVQQALSAEPGSV